MWSHRTTRRGRGRRRYGRNRNPQRPTITQYITSFANRVRRQLFSYNSRQGQQQNQQQQDQQQVLPTSPQQTLRTSVPPNAPTRGHRFIVDEETDAIVASERQRLRRLEQNRQMVNRSAIVTQRRR